MIEINRRRLVVLSLAAHLSGCGGNPPPQVATAPGQPEPPAPPPALALSAAALAFTATGEVGPAPQVIVVSNAGGGDLGPPTAVPDSSLFAATVEGASAPYSVTVSATGYAVRGYFSGSLTIASPGAANGPVVVPLTLLVQPLVPPPPATSASCWVSADSLCQELASACGPALAAFAADCASVGLPSTCPTDGRLGRCRVPSGADQYLYWYSAPAWTEVEALRSCAGMGGAWDSPALRVAVGRP